MEDSKGYLIEDTISEAWDAAGRNRWRFGSLILSLGFLHFFIGMMSDTGIIILYVFAILVMIYLYIGLTKIAIAVVRGKEWSPREMFAQGKYFFRYIGVSLLVFLVTAAGIVLLVIPGVILYLRYSLASYHVLDHDMSISDAMKASAGITKGVKIDIFIILLKFFLIAVLAVIGVSIAINILYLIDSSVVSVLFFLGIGLFEIFFLQTFAVLIWPTIYVNLDDDIEDEGSILEK